MKNMLNKTHPGPEREQLGFKEAVLSSFQFLLSLGFKPVRKETTLVRYESETAFVNIYHGRASYEIGVEVGRLDQPVGYGLSSIVSWAGKEAWDSEGFGRSTMFQVSSREGVQAFVPKVANLLSKYGESFLHGDPVFYQQLEETGKRRASEYVRRQEIERARHEADSAWSRKDFKTVVQSYRLISNNLTEIEAKRLQYAKRHISTSGFGSGGPSRNKS